MFYTLACEAARIWPGHIAEQRLRSIKSSLGSAVQPTGRHIATTCTWLIAYLRACCHRRRRVGGGLTGTVMTRTGPFRTGASRQRNNVTPLHAQSSSTLSADIFENHHSQ